MLDLIVEYFASNKNIKVKVGPTSDVNENTLVVFTSSASTWNQLHGGDEDEHGSYTFNLVFYKKKGTSIPALENNLNDLIFNLKAITITHTQILSCQVTNARYIGMDNDLIFANASISISYSGKINI